MHLKLLQKEQFKKTVEAVGDLIDNKIAKNLSHSNLVTDLQTEKSIEIPIYISNIYISYIYIYIYR